MRGRARSCVLLLPLLVVSAVSRPARAVPPAWNEARIRELRAESRKPGAPDSVTYQLALALASSGTIENRRQAFEAFQSIHAAHEDDPVFCKDVGKLLVDSRQDTKARDFYHRAIELRPRDVDARIEIARIQLREILWHFSRDTGNMTATLH